MSLIEISRIVQYFVADRMRREREIVGALIGESHTKAPLHALCEVGLNSFYSPRRILLTTLPRLTSHDRKFLQNSRVYNVENPTKR
jgi:hypothetical protein